MIFAMIPARGGSKGVPRKNIAMCAGHPLIWWTIKCAYDYGHFDEIVVNTDDPEIAEVSLHVVRVGEVDIYDRPPQLSNDAARTRDVVFDFVLHYRDGENDPIVRDDIIVMLPPTSPIRDPDDIARAVDMVRVNPIASVISGCLAPDPVEWTAPVVDGHWQWDSDPYERTHRRQLCEERYFINGAIWAATAGFILDNHGFNDRHESPGSREQILIMDKAHSLQIDEPADLVICEAMLRHLAGSDE